MGAPSLTQDPNNPRPLLGKYDKRTLPKNADNFRARDSKPGPKPKWRKYLNRKHSTTYLSEMDAIRTPSQMFQDAIESKNYELAWKIRTDVENRVAGKPFVAENPAGNGKVKSSDPNLLIAVNNLTVNHAGKSKKHKPVIDAQAISTQSAGDLPQLTSQTPAPALEQPIQAAKKSPGTA